MNHNAAANSQKDPNCIFCKIIDRQIPAQIVKETSEVLVFKDLSPQAPVHVLVVPKQHFANVGELAQSPELLAKVIKTGSEVAAELADSHFRLIFNTGENAGQTVFHVHGHVLAGMKQAEGSLA